MPINKSTVDCVLSWMKKKKSALARYSWVSINIPGLAAQVISNLFQGFGITTAYMKGEVLRYCLKRQFRVRSACLKMGGKKSQ